MKLSYSTELSTIYSKDVFVLNCNDGPTGTHKDYKSTSVVEYALENGVNIVAAITSGNCGLSLKQKVEETNKQHGAKLTLINIVDNNLNEGIKEMLRGTFSEVRQFDLSSRYFTIEELLQDIKEPVVDATYFDGNYKQLVEAVLTAKPQAISIPLGSGDLFLSFYEQLKYLGILLYGVIPKDNHPLCSKAQTNLEAFLRDYTGNTSADKLSAKFIPPTIEERLKRAFSEGHVLYEADEEELLNAHGLSEQLGFNQEVSGSSSLTALKNIEEHRAVCILTGKGKIQGGR